MFVSHSSEGHAARRALTRGIALAVALVLLQSQPSAATDGRLGEYQIKAGYLYNFAKFVFWPAESFAGPTAAFTICVIGDDPFGPVLDTVVRGRLVGKRALLVRRLTQLKELDGCQILFVGSTTSSAFDEIRERLKNASVLTVGESDWFTRGGGMIRFDVSEARVGFEINTSATTRAQLEISSQLLKVATRVTTDRGTP